ncbi:hypothetical protein SXCC_00867 [Gluconacetobacter sp. SXCC-1]|nr:hypothetical protein SXCC_00867 [Gluconacetobacter sp. SXCC-1]
MADLAEDRLRLDRLAATAFQNFLPLTAAPPFLAKQESSGPAVLRCAAAPAGCSAARLRLVDRHRGHGGRGPITAWRYDNG